jgi:hypothetical protein
MILFFAHVPEKNLGGGSRGGHDWTLASYTVHSAGRTLGVPNPILLVRQE